MKLLPIIILLALLTWAPQTLPSIDFDCDGEITIADALSIPPHYGEQERLALWAYDLDRDGAITTWDSQLVVAQIGRTDLPAPVWCEEDR